MTFLFSGALVSLLFSALSFIFADVENRAWIFFVAQAGVLALLTIAAALIKL